MEDKEKHERRVPRGAVWIQEVNTSTRAPDLTLTARVDKVGYAVENASPFHCLSSASNGRQPSEKMAAGMSTAVDDRQHGEPVAFDDVLEHF